MLSLSTIHIYSSKWEMGWISLLTFCSSKTFTREISLEGDYQGTREGLTKEGFTPGLVFGPIKVGFFLKQKPS